VGESTGSHQTQRGNGAQKANGAELKRFHVPELAHPESWADCSGCNREGCGHRVTIAAPYKLSFAVVVMTVMVVVRRRGESRSGEHEDQKRSSENLLHGGKCSTGPIVEMPLGGT
jgi:hypothetical protein